MQRFQLSLANLHVLQGQVYCGDGNLFDRVAYSRFKYGYTPPGVQYGFGLANLVEAELLQFTDGHPTIIISAPYKHVPTASHVIARAMRQALAISFVGRGLEPPVLVPFHKARTGSGKYARSTIEDRRQSVKTLGPSIDERLVRNANVLVVDDIRISGTAQDTTAAFIEALDPHTVWYLHAARLTEQSAAVHPGIEDELNQTVPKSYGAVLRNYEDGTFMLNARILGFMMKAIKPLAFDWFVTRAPSALLEEMYEGTICSGLVYMQRFPDSLEKIKRELVNRSAPITSQFRSTVLL